ncbi:hypothetical protein HJC23_004794 [Cyclotella cryptica]|uniref:Sulfotransferase domain-containing protein n=1 Tax=Cyclotella cryptica TaxID=29204 RepID=A0ABD3PZ19_9STRA
MVVTGLNTASNYGDSNLGEHGTGELVFQKSNGGPFWTDPKIHKLKPTNGYILTKTHCGSRCDKCGPENYVENHHLFLKECLETTYISNYTENGDSIKSVGSYDKKLVARAVHLIRDPFDNIVSRFHLRHNRFVKLKDEDSLERYPKSREGFRAFCSDLSKLHTDEEEASKFYEDVIEVIRNVPCHADFFRYIQWHNLAFISTWDLQIPTLIIHYENYTNNFNKTKKRLLEFLEQEEVNEPPRFETGKTYRDYFSKEEINAISKMFAMLALDKTWHYTRHYFD